MFPSLATPGNITRNIVSATMFPSLARPLRYLVTLMKGLSKACCADYFTIFDIQTTSYNFKE